MAARRVAGEAGGTGGPCQVRPAGRTACGAGIWIDRRLVGRPVWWQAVAHIRAAPLFPPDSPRRGCGRPSPIAGGVEQVGLVVAVVSVGAPAPATGAGRWNRGVNQSLSLSAAPGG